MPVQTETRNLLQTETRDLLPAMPLDAPAKRKGVRARHWAFPTLEQWKALRWSQDAGCPDDHLSLEESQSLAKTVMGRPGSTWITAQVLEHWSMISLVTMLGQWFLWAHVSSSKPIGTTRSTWLSDHSERPGVPEMHRERKLYASAGHHMKLSLNSDVLVSPRSCLYKAWEAQGGEVPSSVYVGSLWGGLEVKACQWSPGYFVGLQHTGSPHICTAGNLAIVVQVTRVNCPVWWIVTIPTKLQVSLSTTVVKASDLESLHRQLGGWLCASETEVAGTLWSLWTTAAMLQTTALADKDLTCLAGSLRRCAGLGHGPVMEAVVAACLCGGASTSSSAKQSIDTDKLKNLLGRKRPYVLSPIDPQPVLRSASELMSRIGMTLEEARNMGLAPGAAADVQPLMVLDDEDARSEPGSESEALSRDFGPMNPDLRPHLAADDLDPGSHLAAADLDLGSRLSLESVPEPASSSRVPRVKAEPASSSTTTRVKAEPVEPRVKVKAEPRTRSDQRSKGPHSPKPKPLSPGQRNKKLLEVMAEKAKAKAKAKGSAVRKKTLGSRVK